MPKKTTPPKIQHRAAILRDNQSEAEARLWAHLRKHRMLGVHFRRQYAIGNYIVDFCAIRKKLVIELDGSQHLDQANYDAERTAFLNARGYRILRFWNNEVINDLQAVLLVIMRALEGPLPALPQIQKFRGG